MTRDTHRTAAEGGHASTMELVRVLDPVTVGQQSLRVPGSTSREYFSQGVLLTRNRRVSQFVVLAPKIGHHPRTGKRRLP